MPTFLRTSLLALLLFCLASSAASAQALPGATRFSVDGAAGYTAIHANAGPGVCGCFYMTGASGELAFKNSRRTSFVVNFGRTEQPNVSNIGEDLKLYTLLEGARYTLNTEGRFSPFGEALVGVSHTASNFEVYKSTNAAALLFGGGLDVRLSRRISVRPVEAGWLFTTHLNNVNNFQNQIRLSGGLVFHLHRAEWD